MRAKRANEEKISGGYAFICTDVSTGATVSSRYHRRAVGFLLAISYNRLDIVQVARLRAGLGNGIRDWSRSGRERLPIPGFFSPPAVFRPSSLFPSRCCRFAVVLNSSGLTRRTYRKPFAALVTYLVTVFNLVLLKCSWWKSSPLEGTHLECSTLSFSRELNQRAPPRPCRICLAPCTHNPDWHGSARRVVPTSTQPPRVYKQ